MILDICWISFSRINISCIHCNFVFMVQQMIFCKFPYKKWTLLTHYEASCSLISCMLQHIMFCEFPSQEKLFLAFYAWYSTWCFITFLVNKCLSHTLQLRPNKVLNFFFYLCKKAGLHWKRLTCIKDGQIKFCQAQYQLQLNFSWAELVLHPADPPTHPATHLPILNSLI